MNESAPTMKSFDFWYKLYDENRFLKKRIAELESAQRWHVVADGDLPNTYKPVLTVDMSEATRIPVPAFYNLDTNCWSTHFEYDLWVTHWMPLPEAPKERAE